jgi:hypothetical protein
MFQAFRSTKTRYDPGVDRRAGEIPLAKNEHMEAAGLIEAAMAALKGRDPVSTFALTKLKEAKDVLTENEQFPANHPAWVANT